MTAAGGCRVCRHEERATVDRELAAGVPVRVVARRFALPVSALADHRRGGHMQGAAVLEHMRREAVRLDVPVFSSARNWRAWTRAGRGRTW